MTDEELDAHNTQNDNIRREYVDFFKNKYKKRERDKTQDDDDNDGVTSQGEAVDSGANDGGKVGGSEEGKEAADGEKDGGSVQRMVRMLLSIQAPLAATRLVDRRMAKGLLMAQRMAV